MANSSGLAPVISATGVSAGTFSEWQAYFVSVYQSIFGADSYLGNDSQDGQYIGAIAQAAADCCASVIAAYNAQSPASAQGTGLSSVVKINGLARIAASYSTAPATLVGVANTPIANGQILDQSGNLWDLPASVDIPVGGSITVTVTAAAAGPVIAEVGTAKIQTPLYGWNSATIAANTTVGIVSESDAALRVRQSNSTTNPSQTIFDGIWDAIEAVPGVTRTMGYENNTNAANGNGVPAYSSAFVVEGGAEAPILNAIAGKAPPGSAFYGTTSSTVIDANGASKVVAFSIAGETAISVVLTIVQLAGWSAVIGTAIQNAIVAYITSLPIGAPVGYFALLGPALAPLVQYPGTYEITAMTVNGGTVDIAIAWNAAATSVAADITI